MILKGTISEIIYRNNETGYTILEMKKGDAHSTIVGKFPPVGAGQDAEVEGTFISDPKYGRQFSATSIKVSQPVECENIIRYLGSGLISGVGLRTAINIVNKFKKETLSIIENEPQKLVEVKGISERKAVEIAKTFQDIKKMQAAVMFLQTYDITITTAVKIYNAYKDRTEEVLKSNPYKLVEDVEGIGFKTADKIAFKIGVQKESPFRLSAGVMYCLNEFAERQGSTVIRKDKLAETCVGLLELPNEYIGEILGIITNLEIEGKLKSTTLDDEPAVAIAKFYAMEKYIAEKLKILQDSVYDINADFDNEIAEFEKINNITFHESQRKAIVSAIKDGVAVITGGPGTGKTTIIKAILYILKNHKQETMLLAPTGRAAKRMEEQTKQPASTIHRGLEMGYRNGKLGFIRNENNVLEVDAVIVDEVSMIDVYLMSSLLKAIDRKTRLILVGDKDQLMSVGAGNVLADIIGSKVITTLELTQIFRQAETSKIVLNAHTINKGEMPDFTAKSEDFFYSSSYNPDEVANGIVNMVATRIPNYNKDIKTEDIQVIVPTKSGTCGTNNLNILLREKLNPKTEDKKEMQIHNTIFREGDKVMQTSNNYEMEWVKQGEGETIIGGMGVFNGDMGYIDEINTQSGEVYVCFDDGRRAGYSIVELEDLVHAYAITVHKSQGSEFDVIIIPILAGNPVLYNKNLLYTAVTRAKKMVVLIGKQTNIYAMIKNEYQAQRNTLLKRFLTTNNLF